MDERTGQGWSATLTMDPSTQGSIGEAWDVFGINLMAVKRSPTLLKANHFIICPRDHPS